MDESSHDNALATGVTAIDREHILELIVVREVQASLRAGAREQARTLLERLADITEAHFLTETLLMRQHAYDGYEAHQREHDRLIAELQDFSRIRAGGPAPRCR